MNMTALDDARLHKLSDDIERVAGTNINLEHLDADQSFEPLELYKDDAVFRAREIVELLRASQVIHPDLQAEAFELISTYTEIGRVAAENAAKLIGSELPATDRFRQRRGEIIGVAQAALNAAKKRAFNVRPWLEVRAASITAPTPAELSASGETLDYLIGENKRLAAEADRVLTVARDAAFESGKSKTVQGFKRLRDAHTKRQGHMRWALGFAAVMVVATASVLVIGKPDWFFEVTGESEPLAQVHFVLRSLVLLTVPAVFMRIALKQFNLERNLAIIFDHRIAVVEQFEVTSALIGEQDREALERLRLEMFRLTSGDPRTGYADEKASEVSVTPITNVLDIAGRTTFGR